MKYINKVYVKWDIWIKYVVIIYFIKYVNKFLFGGY